MKTETHRLHGADLLRAIACLAVIFHHLLFRLDSDSMPGWFGPIRDVGLMGSFGVAAFLVLSGFLLARPFWLALDAGRPLPSLGVYTLRRMARILPGFWLALGVSFIASLTVFEAVLDTELVLRFFAGVLLVSDWHWMTFFPVEGNGPLWSIGFEVTSYLLLPVCLLGLFLLPPDRRQAWRTRGIWLGVIGLVLAAHALIVWLAPIDEIERGWNHGIVGGAKQWMPRYNPIGFFALFALGALAASVQVMLSRISSWLFDALSVLGLALAGASLASFIGTGTEGFGWLGMPYGFPLFPLGLGLFLATCPSSRLLGPASDVAPVRYLASISFGLYLWHFLVIGVMGREMPLAFDNTAGDPWLIWLGSSAVAIAISVGVAHASYRFVEQPVVSWAKGLEPRLGRVPAPA